MKENQFKSQYIIKTKASKNFIFFKKFPVFLGANSNLKRVDAGAFNLKKKNDYFQLQNNSISKNINKIYSNKKYKHNTPPPNRKGWGSYLSEKQFLNIKKYLKKDLKILEIGAGSTFFAEKIIKDYPTTKYTIVDPSIKKKSKYKNLNIINKHFPNKIYFKEKFDLIIIFNCLEHIYDVKKTVRSLKKNVTDDGNILVEVPDITYQLKNSDFNMFTFEHYNYFDSYSLRRIFKKEGLNLKSYKSYNDTLFCIFKKSKVNSVVTFHNKFDLRKYEKKIIKLKKIFNSLLIKKVKFGIHGANFGAYNVLFLLNLIDDKRIKIFDSDQGKVGKYFGSKYIKVKKAYSKEYKKIDVLFISALSFINEIKKEIKIKKIKFKQIKSL